MGDGMIDTFFKYNEIIWDSVDGILHPETTTVSASSAAATDWLDAAIESFNIAYAVEDNYSKPHTLSGTKRSRSHRNPKKVDKDTWAQIVCPQTNGG